MPRLPWPGHVSTPTHIKTHARKHASTPSQRSHLGERCLAPAQVAVARAREQRHHGWEQQAAHHAQVAAVPQEFACSGQGVECARTSAQYPWAPRTQSRWRGAGAGAGAAGAAASVHPGAAACVCVCVRVCVCAWCVCVCACGVCVCVCSVQWMVGCRRARLRLSRGR